MKNSNMSLTEINTDILANLALATTAGVITASAATKLYKKYKQNKILKNYIKQGNKKQQSNLSDEMRGIVADIINPDIIRQLK